jgi:hypothetical protein
MDEDEASQAAYCLLAMSRGSSGSNSSHDRLSCKGGAASALSAALGHQTVMEQPAATTSPYSSTKSTMAAASTQTSLNRNDGLVVARQQESPFMIARILTDLTRVRQDLFSVEPLQQPTATQPPPPSSCKPSAQRNQSKHQQNKTFLTFHHHLYYCTPHPDDISNEFFFSLPYRFLDVLDAVQGGSGSKLHHCSYPTCERTYGKSSHLKAHMRTHTGRFSFVNDEIFITEWLVIYMICF